jgi:hypothetical protein
MKPVKPDVTYLFIGAEVVEKNRGGNAVKGAHPPSDLVETIEIAPVHLLNRFLPVYMGEYDPDPLPALDFVQLKGVYIWIPVNEQVGINRLVVESVSRCVI